MISDALKTLQSGLLRMRTDSRLLLVGILLFVFPLLFVWITQSFFATASSNIDSAQKQRVSIVHDSLAVVFRQTNEAAVGTLIDQYVTDNTGITKIKIVEITKEGAMILFSSNNQEVGTLVQSDELFQTLPISGQRDALIYPTTINGARTWQVFSGVADSLNNYIIFSEHSFQLIDSVMLARQQQSYLGLTIIFLFLIGLAYWINRQKQWEKHSHALQQRLQERDLFSNMIAHEFRTPLTAIKGYASFLEESQSVEAEDKRYASIIRVSAERLVLLVNDFLEVARLQSGKIEINKKTIDVSPMLASVCEDLQLTAKKKGLQLVYKAPKHNTTLRTDQARLTQIMTNLLSNSIKYSESGIIEVECYTDNKKLTIRIKDTGMGMTAVDQQKLFTPFVRVGNVDHTVTPGTGLGMWITKQLVELLGGEIGVESIKGVGTHVTVSFYE
jgi:signal transduction histidine kinase